MNKFVIDPRDSVIKDRMISIKNIWLVSGFKGGIGKSLVSVAISLGLSDKNYKVGLLDLDLVSATVHLILGSKNLYPKEDMGLVPPEFEGIKFMSFQFFSRSSPFAIRGSSITNAIKELLCVTLWGKLDFLIVDMPPGFSDTTFDVANIFRNFSVLTISTPSPLSKLILNRMINLYTDMNIKSVCVENMSKTNKKKSIRFDSQIDMAIGNVKKIKKTNFYKDVLKILPEIEKGK